MIPKRQRPTTIAIAAQFSAIPKTVRSKAKRIAAERDSGIERIMQAEAGPHNVARFI
ncbi:MAG TPA: hypothetical protein VGF77_04315 [Allosphingosinicella sp.]